MFQIEVHDEFFNISLISILNIKVRLKSYLVILFM